MAYLPPTEIYAVSVDNGGILHVPVQPKATFQNIGSATQTFDVTLTTAGYTSTKTITSLPPSASQQVTFDDWSPSLGNYTLTAYSTLPADTVNANDTTRKSIKVYPGYYKESFEDTFPSPGWQVWSFQGNDHWIRERLTAHSGKNSIYINHDYPAGEDWLIMPKFTIANGDSLTFWMQLYLKNDFPDTLQIRIATSDSAEHEGTVQQFPITFRNIILDISNLNGYPITSGTWARYSVDLSSYAGQSIYLAFRHYDEQGDGVFLDDITVGKEPAGGYYTIKY